MTSRRSVIPSAATAIGRVVSLARAGNHTHTSAELAGSPVSMLAPRQLFGGVILALAWDRTRRPVSANTLALKLSCDSYQYGDFRKCLLANETSRVNPSAA